MAVQASETVEKTLPIRKMARENDDFRRVVRTGAHSQIVLMSVPPGESIGLETHEHIDQILVFVEGEGRAFIDGEEHAVGEGDMAFVPAGMKHDFVATGSAPLKLFTAYTPPEHASGTVHETKAEAEADHE
jgi:mannose-6-phosphate isomerase-like protein (cupin superfamily)